MNQKFSSAVHALILIADSSRPLTSEEIAKSVGTNASYIRRIIGLLKKKDIVASHRGVSGFSLRLRSEDLTLLKIYQAVSNTDRPRFFDLHGAKRGESDSSRQIRPVLSRMFSKMEDDFSASLAKNTLADCIRILRKQRATLPL